MSDGLTVPFALAAGLSGAVDNSFVFLVAGVAEMAAGSMAMGLGGYLAARSEADSYQSELGRERAEVSNVPIPIMPRASAGKKVVRNGVPLSHSVGRRGTTQMTPNSAVTPRNS
jgi:VIT family protein